MSEETKKAAEDFATPGLLRQNAVRWGYSQVGFLTDGIVHSVGSRVGFRPAYQCDHCACTVVVRGGGPFGDKCPLVIHAIHCVGITFGVRYIRSRNKMSPI
jgi:hypothetical protein